MQVCHAGDNWEKSAISEADKFKSLLRRDPSLLSRILLARARTILLPTPKRVVRKRLGSAVYDFDFTDPGLRDSFQHSRPAIKAMLCCSYEPILLKVMRRFLTTGGTFIDVGANIGYISAVGAGLVGPTGQVHSFEPVPPYFRRLQRMAELNPKHSIVPNNVALGAEDGMATITLTKDNIGGNSLIPDVDPSDEKAETFEVPVRRLSDYLTGKNIKPISLIKIDVEGFEFPVLQGLSDYWAASAHRPPIVCEVNPDAAGRLDYAMADFADYMTALGYRAYDMIGWGVPLDITQMTEYGNVLFRAVKD